MLHGAPIKNCVFAFVLPEGKVWDKVAKTSEQDGWDLLLNAADPFKSACHVVCAIPIL